MAAQNIGLAGKSQQCELGDFYLLHTQLSCGFPMVLTHPEIIWQNRLEGAPGGTDRAGEG